MSIVVENSHAYDYQVQQDKLQLLYRQSYPAVFFSLLAIFLYIGIIYPYLDSSYTITWVVIAMLATLLRLFLFIVYRYKQPSGDEIFKWKQPYFVSLIFSSLVWGIGVVVLAGELPFLYQVVSYLFALGMAGAALSVYSAIRYFAISAAIVVFMPIILMFFYLGTQTSTLIASSGLIFLASAFRANRITSDALHHSYMLTHALQYAKVEAEKLASTDMLTGINNRRAFTELATIQVEYCKRYEHPVSALVLDVDRFKDINDERGHNAGDAALRHLALILQQITRSSDIIGRIGGEEFAVLLSNTSMDEALMAAEKLRKWIADHPVHINDEYFSITVSIGVAEYCDYNLEKLLIQADKAMYLAKQSGRNKVMAADCKSKHKSV